MLLWHLVYAVANHRSGAGDGLFAKGKELNAALLQGCPSKSHLARDGFITIPTVATGEEEGQADDHEGLFSAIVIHVVWSPSTPLVADKPKRPLQRPFLPQVVNK